MGMGNMGGMALPQMKNSNQNMNNNMATPSPTQPAPMFPSVGNNKAAVQGFQDLPLSETGGLAGFSSGMVANDMGATSKSKTGRKRTKKGQGKRANAKDATDGFSNIRAED